jgi:hypothetical protein
MDLLLSEYRRRRARSIEIELVIAVRPQDRASHNRDSRPSVAEDRRVREHDGAAIGRLDSSSVLRDMNVVKTDVRSSRVNPKTNPGVQRDSRVSDRAVGVCTQNDAIAYTGALETFNADIVKRERNQSDRVADVDARTLDGRGASGRKNRVFDIDLLAGAGGQSYPDVPAGRRTAESGKGTALDIKLAKSEPVYPMDTRTRSIEGQVSESDDGCGTVDDNTAAARRQDRAKTRAGGAIDRNGLGNGNRAKTTWIKHVDFAVCSSLGNRSGKCLAGGGAATGVRVVTDARHPGARCLSLRDGRESNHKNRNGQCIEGEPKLIHLEFSFLD